MPQKEDGGTLLRYPCPPGGSASASLTQPALCLCLPAHLKFPVGVQGVSIHVSWREDTGMSSRTSQPVPTLILRGWCPWAATTCLQSETRGPVRALPQGTTLFFS